MKASHLLFFIRGKVGHSSLNQAFSQEFVSRHRWHTLQHPNQQPRRFVVKKKKHVIGWSELSGILREKEEERAPGGKKAYARAEG